MHDAFRQFAPTPTLPRKRGREQTCRVSPMYPPTANPEPNVTLPLMGFGEEVVNDYRFLELSLRAHPASFLRGDLTARGIIRNEALRTQRSGEHAIVSGLVTIRQRPGTASGVIFMTIEDETAIANIIVWPKIFERFRAIILGARYIAVSGTLQHEIRRDPFGRGAACGPHPIIGSTDRRFLAGPVACTRGRGQASAR